MSGFRASVTANEDVETLLRCDQAEVLVLRFRTFAHAAGYAAFELVGAADTLVSLLEADGHADTVTDSEAAPCSANTGLYRAE